MLIPQRGRKFSIGMTRWCPDKDRKSTRLNSSHTVIYTLSLHDALPILAPFVLAAVVLGAGGYALYRLGVDQGMKVAGSVTSASSAATGAPQKAGDVDPTTGKKVLYWHDPMVPGQRSEEHTSELQSHSDLHSFPTRRSSDLGTVCSGGSCSGRRRLRAVSTRRRSGHEGSRLCYLC